MKQSEAGFTIVELMAAMVISSLVVALSLAMYLFAERLMGNWQKRTELTGVVDRCTQAIAEDAFLSSNLYESNDSSLVLGEAAGDTVSYEFSHGRVLRNKTPFDMPGNHDGGVGRGTLSQLDVSVVTSVDTVTGDGWPVRLWTIRVFGHLGNLQDSLAVRTTSLMSSREIVLTGSLAKVSY